MRLLRYAGVVVLVVFLVSGCNETSLTPDQKALVEKAMQCPLSFTVNASEAGKVWGDAQVLISQYSDMKLQIITDYLLETYTPRTGTWDEYLIGFRVTKVLQGTNYVITVEAPYDYNGSGLRKRAKNEAEKRAHVLAYQLQQNVQTRGGTIIPGT